MKSVESLVQGAKDEILRLYKELAESSKTMGIEPNELLTKIQVAASKDEQEKMEIMKKQFGKMGKLELFGEKDRVIDARIFIEQVIAMQKMGMSKQDMSQIFGISVEKFEKKYQLLKTEIDTKTLEKRLTNKDLEFLEEIKQSIRKSNSNRAENMKYKIPVDDKLAMMTSYIELKDFFLGERNKGLIPDTRGYITEESFFDMLRENNKLLTHSLDNKIKPIAELVERYYTRNEANYIFMNFPRIFGTSYEKLTCNLEIVKDEECAIEMLRAPKNYMCSPVKIFSGIKEWKLNRTRALSTSIIKAKNNVELPEKYQNILYAKKKPKERESRCV